MKRKLEPIAKFRNEGQEVHMIDHRERAADP
jgi:hypothetical protein